MPIAFKVELAGPVALSTGVAILVHLGAFTLEAWNLLSARVLLVRHQNVAFDLLFAYNNILHLVSAFDCFYGWLATTKVFGFHSGLVTGYGGLRAG